MEAYVPFLAVTHPTPHGHGRSGRICFRFPMFFSHIGAALNPESGSQLLIWGMMRPHSHRPLIKWRETTLGFLEGCGAHTRGRTWLFHSLLQWQAQHVL